MKRISYLCLSYFLIFSLASANEVRQEGFKKYLPQDSKILDQYEADLNQDGLTDIILVVAKKEENRILDGDAPHRSLIILFSGRNGYIKAMETDTVVYCKTCGGLVGDPYVGISVKPPFFTIEHYGGSAWRWNQYITFKYSKEHNEFILHKLGTETFHASSPEKIETKIQTKKDFGVVKIQDFDIYHH